MLLNRRILFLFFAISLHLSGLAQCPNDIGQIPNVSNNGLIIYFPFNGNSINQGSSSYTATVSGANYSTGICGQAMQFDGVDDYLKLNPFVPMTGNFTIAAWVYIDSMQNNLAIFSTRDQCATTYRGYSQAEFFINYYNSVQGNYPQELNFNVNQHQNCTGYSAGDRYNAQNYTFTSSSWHFVALTVQNNSNDSRVVNFYIDCQLHSTVQYMNYPSGSSFNPNNNNKSFIGAASDVNNYIYSFNGKIDEFRLYNRVLTSSELKNLYYKCKPLNVIINKYINSCNGDSAIIELINSQDGVNYQLYDSTNQQFVGSIQSGSCNNLIFSTGIVLSPTDFYIKATKTSSNCILALDTMFSLNPISGGYTIYDSISVCSGDSVNINGVYYFPPSIISDSLIDILGCDSILITNLISIQLPFVSLGNDTSFCTGDSILLTVNNSYSSILWSTGATLDSIFISSTGVFWVEIDDSICKNSDTINIINQSTTYIDIEDSTFCIGDTWSIILPNINQYIWSDGSIGSSFSVNNSGLYWVEITNHCKAYTDTFRAETIDCSCLITIPNAFTPNGDGINDNFFAVINCELDQYQMYIFNRWGKLLYESTDQFEVWNGKYKEKEVPDGVYFYLLKYTHKRTSNKEEQLTGSITIFR